MTKIISVLLLSVGFVFLNSCSKPEAKLADRIEDMEEIMNDHMDDPDEGVEELIEYLEKHGPDTVKLMMEAGIEISNIEGDGDRDERIKEANEKLKVIFKNFQGTAEKFEKKVSNNKEAKERAENYERKWEELFSAMQNLL